MQNTKLKNLGQKLALETQPQNKHYKNQPDIKEQTEGYYK
jgi:hypothetical protein